MSKCWKWAKMTPYSVLGADLKERVRAFLWALQFSLVKTDMKEGRGKKKVASRRL